jgi:putative transposase
MTTNDLLAEFRERGSVRGGACFFGIETAVALIQRAQEERIPVLGLEGFRLSDAGTAPSLNDIADFSTGVEVSDGCWSDALRFLEERRDSGVHFEVVSASAPFDSAEIRGAICAESSLRRSRATPARAVRQARARAMSRRRTRQLELPVPNTWGGRRAGAGRKPSSARPRAPHRSRPAHDPRHPVHVTLRAVSGLTSLRSDRVFSDLRRSLASATCESFRVIHFSVQVDHLHLIVEAHNSNDLSRGLQGLGVRCARAVNRAVGRRGSVWAERYHAHPLRTPREVRFALVYVLLNFRKHLRASPGVDPRSSGPWFNGWAHDPTVPTARRPVGQPRTWLASVGWRRAGGPIDYRETPAAPPPT